MADIVSANIKPGGLTQKFEVELWSMLFRSLQGIATKLDADATAAATYLAAVWTALFNAQIDDGKGNNTMNFVREENFYSISPSGISNAARHQLIYQFFNMLSTLCVACDDDGLDSSDYEALCYTAIMTQMVEDTKGNILGNLDTDTGFYFRPGGGKNDKQLVQFFYNAVNAIETLTEKLDVDGATTPPTDTDYEALWFTAVILCRVEDGKGNVVGNTYPQN